MTLAILDLPISAKSPSGQADGRVNTDVSLTHPSQYPEHEQHQLKVTPQIVKSCLTVSKEDMSCFVSEGCLFKVIDQ